MAAVSGHGSSTGAFQTGGAILLIVTSQGQQNAFQKSTTVNIGQ